MVSRIGYKVFSYKKAQLHKYAMLWLASMPLLGIYQSPVIFSWKDIFFFILLSYAVVSNETTNLFGWPKTWIFFWSYISIFFLYSCTEYGHIYQGILPGGVSFFIYSLQLGVMSKLLNLTLLYKYMRNITIFSIIVMFLQEISALITGLRFSALIPWGSLTDGMPILELRSIQTYADRPCSIFREPAHFAQYLMPILALELFWKSKDKLITPFALLMVITIVFLRSGNGLVGLLVFALIKIISYLKNQKVFIKLTIIISLFTIITFGLGYIAQTSIGDELIGRTSEFEKSESSKSYIRMYRGFDLYLTVPTRFKLLGTNNDGIIELIKHSTASYLFDGERESDLYFNGISGILLHTGAIGLTLIVIFYVNIYRKSDNIGQSLIIILAVLSFIAQTYLSSFMLICTVIPSFHYLSKRGVSSKRNVNTAHPN